MKLSHRTQYAVLALSHLVRSYSPGQYVQIADIAEQEGISRKFLEQIMLELRKGGVVESKAGRHGGYRLAGAPHTLSLGHALRAMEGRLTPIPSWVEGAGGLAALLLECRYAVREILDKSTLQVLAEGTRPEVLAALSEFV